MELESVQLKHLLLSFVTSLNRIDPKLLKDAEIFKNGIGN